MFGKMCFCSAVILGMCGDAFAYTDPQINQLISEKQQKIDALQKCTGQAKGFKIAGISTIGLTTVGVATNVVLANKKQTTTMIRLDVSKDGVGRLFKDIYDGDSGNGGTFDKCTTSVSSKGDWCAQFDEYIVNGISTCVSDNGTYAETTSNSYDSAKSDGKYCYCKMTSWTPNGSSANNTSASSWVFLEDVSSEIACAYEYCAGACAYNVQTGSGFREAMFGAIK
ncbi:MAG: hypothetical protein K5912_02375 [Alphaproteobacteria bacterium]|nr:hypothetical protein [Alphaproteobacteria bacterium]